MTRPLHPLLPIAAILAVLLLHSTALAQTNFQFRVMAANLTSGTDQSYEAPGIRLFQGLQPDIVAIQEFRYNASSSGVQLRALVDTAFGTNFYYYCEPYTAAGDIPNGIVSRWPIASSGSWDDPVLANRGFAWALIDLPGSNDLYVVSVHLYSGNATDRNTEAAAIRSNILQSFPAEAWIVVAGDLNTGNRSESALGTLSSVVTDSPVPADQAGNGDTSANRNYPYDYVLQSPSLGSNLVTVQLGALSFPNGLVFDSRVYSSLSSVPPIQAGDSGASGMQHMAVIKQYQAIAPGATNPPPTPAPASTNVLVQWNFNNTNASLLSPPPSSGTGTVSLVGGTTSAYFTGSDGDTNTGNFGWSTTTYPAISSANKFAGVQIQVNTVGWSNLTVRWDQRNSSTASKYLRLQYATNGLDFIDYPTGISMTASGAWVSVSNSLAGLPGVENNTNLLVRLVAEFAPGTGSYAGTTSSYGTAGTIRYDLLTVLGTRIDARVPATLAAARAGNNTVQVSVAGAAAQAYILQTTTNLGAPNWAALLTNTAPFTFTESNVLSRPTRFYRAVTVP